MVRGGRMCALCWVGLEERRGLRPGPLMVVGGGRWWGEVGGGFGGGWCAESGMYWCIGGWIGFVRGDGGVM